MRVNKTVWSVAPVDSVDGQDSIAAHIAVSVLQAGTDGWH